MDDNDIISLFNARSEEAIVELSKKYGKMCLKISYNILGNVEDSEECVNDSYFKIWNIIPPENPNPLMTFLLKIVRNLSLKRHTYNSRKKRDKANTYDECLEELDYQFTSNYCLEKEVEDKFIVSAINSFIETLDDTAQMLFIRRYWYMDSYKELSKISGLKESSIRAKLLRIRKKLDQFLRESGVIE